MTLVGVSATISHPAFDVLQISNFSLKNFSTVKHSSIKHRIPSRICWLLVVLVKYICVFMEFLWICWVCALEIAHYIIQVDLYCGESYLWRHIAFHIHISRCEPFEAGRVHLCFLETKPCHGKLRLCFRFLSNHISKKYNPVCIYFQLEFVRFTMKIHTGADV